MEIISKINQLIEKIKVDEDERRLVDEMIEACRGYFEKVITTSKYAQFGRFDAQDSRAYAEEAQKLDEARSRSHNALLSTLSTVDRICASHHVPPIYGGDYQDRRAAAEFAKSLVNEYFDKGQGK